MLKSFKESLNLLSKQSREDLTPMNRRGANKMVFSLILDIMGDMNEKEKEKEK